MDEILKKAEKLRSDLLSTMQKLKIDEKLQILETINALVSEPNFWLDQHEATARLKQQSKLQLETEVWQKLNSEVKEIIELAKLADESLLQSLSTDLQNCLEKYEELKRRLQFLAPFDDHDAVISIFAGAGGTDAQDWAQMLMRMYLRWSENHNLKIDILEESLGEEAGIKSVTMTVGGGSFIYGKLKGEHGVHRLVRLSPFNSDSLRQTSFARVEISPQIDAPEEVAVDEKELKIDVYRAGGHGGQSVNTTDSAVRITHLPTNIVVAIQNERSQLQNKETAMKLLRGKLAKLQLEQHKEKISELKGPNEQAAWGNQIRSYVLHPYNMVKDLRTRFETTNTQAVLDGDLDSFIEAYGETIVEP